MSSAQQDLVRTGVDRAIKDSTINEELESFIAFDADVRISGYAATRWNDRKAT
jgi:hypothetical protein